MRNPIRRALISNLDARLPVELSIRDSSYGHAIVGDGYGYSDGTLYLHFNMGWNGNGDAWYAPPDMNVGGYDFSVIDGIVYNIFTEQGDNHAVCSGRVLSASGVPIAGATVSAWNNGESVAEVCTDGKGIYAFVLPAWYYYGGKPYVIHAEYGGDTAERAVSLRMSITTKVSADGTYNPNTAPTAQVGNLIGQDLILASVVGVASPVFTPAPGLFHSTVPVSLACVTEGAVVRYTLDGSEPTETSEVFAGPFVLDRTTTVKAKAFKTGEIPSATVTAEYVYDVGADAPEGDYFSHPIILSGSSGAHTIMDPSLFTKEDGEPIHSLNNGSYFPEARSAWYRWTAPGTGEMTFRVRSNRRIGAATYMLHAMIAVYRGDRIQSMERIALFDGFDDQVRATVSFDAVQGEEYRLVVFAYAGEDVVGPYALSWTGELTMEPSRLAITGFFVVGDTATLTLGSNLGDTDFGAWLADVSLVVEFSDTPGGASVSISWTLWQGGQM